MTTKRCVRCVLPEHFPGVSFDNTGLCTLCQRSPSITDLASHRASLLERMERVIQERNQSESYDCIVAYSGGKDSTYTLWLLSHHYKLRCLAVTIDNGFISEQALKNCAAVTEALGVDSQIFRPSPNFMRSMYVTSASEQVHPDAALKRASSICNSCIGVINNYVLRSALQQNIPLIAGGYIGGQVPKDSAVMKVDIKVLLETRDGSTKRYAQAFGPQAKKYFDISRTLLEQYTGSHVTILNPMLTQSVTEQELILQCETLGWVQPKDTGRNSSNCLLNDLGIYLHSKDKRFNPYVFEIADQVRSGLMPRTEGLSKVEAVPKRDNVTGIAEKLGLKI